MTKDHTFGTIYFGPFHIKDQDGYFVLLMFKGSKGDGVWVKVQHKTKTILSAHLMIDNHMTEVFFTHTHIYLIDLHQTCINWDQAEIDKTAERIPTHAEGDKRGNYFHDQI